MGKQRDGIKYLANVIDRRSKNMIKGDESNDIAIELATVKSKGIKVDSFSKIMDDYLVCKGVDIAEGDRVLIAWIGSDICVIGSIDS